MFPISIHLKMTFSRFERTGKESGKKVQSWKHEDMNSDFQYPTTKLGLVICVSKVSSGDLGEYLELIDQLSKSSNFIFNGDLLLKRWKVSSLSLFSPFSPLPQLSLTYTYTNHLILNFSLHMHTHPYVPHIHIPISILTLIKHCHMHT